MVSILKKKIDDNLREWADLIPEVLRAYTTTIKNSIGRSLYSLTFGIEALALAKLVWYRHESYISMKKKITMR